MSLRSIDIHPRDIRVGMRLGYNQREVISEPVSEGFLMSKGEPWFWHVVTTWGNETYTYKSKVLAWVED